MPRPHLFLAGMAASGVKVLSRKGSHSPNTDDARAVIRGSIVTPPSHSTAVDSCLPASLFPPFVKFFGIYLRPTSKFPATPHVKLRASTCRLHTCVRTIAARNYTGTPGRNSPNTNSERRSKAPSATCRHG